MISVLLQRFVPLGLCLCALLAPCRAALLTQAQLLERYPALQETRGVISCTVGEERLLLLSDADRRPAAIVAAGDQPELARRFAASIGFESTQESESETALVMLRESVPTKKRLTENTPLQALSYLTEQNYYRPTDLLPDGRVLWATGKRRSLDLLVPTTGNTPLRFIEIKVGTELTTFAANVLARKLGYPADNSADATKASLCAPMGASDVLYYNAARSAAVIRKGNRAYIGEGNAESFRHLNTDTPALPFTATRLPSRTETTEQTITRTAPSPPREDAENTATKPSADPLPESAPKTPKEALKAYLRKLRAL